MLTCILSFNHPQLTAKCVKQTLDHVDRHDLLLIHNGSKTENVELLKLEFPQIEHLIINDNHGFTSGANQALNYAFKKSEWVFFLTNDCLLQNKPTCPTQHGLYAPLVYRRNQNKIDSVGAVFYPHKKKLIHLRDVELAKKLTNKIAQTRLSRAQRIAKAWTGYFYIPGTAFFIDQFTFAKLGAYDESLHTYWEDVDLSVRAHHLGLNLGLALETKIIHKVGKTCHKDPFYTNTLFQRNRKTICRRYSLLSSFFSKT